MTQREIIEKKEKIYQLLFNVDDELVIRFFDENSNKMLDEKIDVLTRLVNGEKPEDIPNYYDILESYDPNAFWD